MPIQNAKQAVNTGASRAMIRLRTNMEHAWPITNTET